MPLVLGNPRKCTMHYGYRRCPLHTCIVHLFLLKRSLTFRVICSIPFTECIKLITTAVCACFTFSNMNNYMCISGVIYSTGECCHTIESSSPRRVTPIEYSSPKFATRSRPSPYVRRPTTCRLANKCTFHHTPRVCPRTSLWCFSGGHVV